MCRKSYIAFLRKNIKERLRKAANIFVLLLFLLQLFKDNLFLAYLTGVKIKLHLFFAQLSKDLKRFNIVFMLF